MTLYPAVNELGVTTTYTDLDNMTVYKLLILSLCHDYIIRNSYG